MDTPPAMFRPVRTAIIVTSCNAGMIVITAPFVGFDDPVIFVVAGVGYSLFLSVFGVGVVLAATSRIFGWWLISALIPLGGLGVTAVWFKPSPEIIASDRSFMWLQVVQIVDLAWIGLGCVVAASGWVNFVRRQRLDNSMRK